LIGALFRSVWTLIVLCVVGWFVFFVPLGERTLFQHLRRIAGTEEAQELGRAAVDASRKLGEDLEREIQSARDAGPPPR
jgi:hypothetical protein